MYDSRQTNDKLPSGVDRVLSVANSIDGTLDVVPRLATAVTLTVTITETEGNGGFVSIRPQGATFNETSSINWFGPNQNVGTTVVSGLGGDRQIVARGPQLGTERLRRLGHRSATLVGAPSRRRRSATAIAERQR